VLVGKVCIIGFDGGSLELVERWAGALPNLRRLMSEGSVGALRSTIPPVTSPAWNCMISGCNPGKVGVYGFFHEENGRFRTTNYKDQAVPAMWDLMGDAGRRVGVVNVPVTFPPNPVNGFLVSGGLFSPMYREVRFTYPRDLQEVLDRVAGGYEVMPIIDLGVPGKERHYLAEIRRHIERQTRAVEYLLRTEPWDFFMYVLFVIDPTQHYFWRYMDRTHPLHDARGAARYGDAIQSIYRMADEALGRFLATLPSDTTVLVVSDHGFGPMYGYFLVNEWLRREGFLALRPGSGAAERRPGYLLRMRSHVLRRLDPRAIRFVLRWVPRRLLQRFTIGGLAASEFDDVTANVDWSRTAAYGGLSGGGNIRINLAGREPHGSVPPEEYDAVRQKIVARLLELRDPAGRPVVTKVYRREELYQGPYVDRAPDLLFVIDDCHYDQLLRLGGKGGEIWTSSYPRTGWHGLRGMFIAHGPQIKPGRLAEVRLVDIAPTALHLMGMTVPAHMDGRVVSEMLRDDAEAARRPVEISQSHERERIRERVRRLRGTGRAWP
jgi:predicted AlkP superfamily phosphohydrolase/phosphomutase